MILNPNHQQVVYASILGFEGEESARRAVDITGWFARAGILDVMHDKGIAPAPPAEGVGDHATAMTLFGAIMMAPYRRKQTGDGRHLMLALAVPKQEWPRLAKALGHPEWIEDPRFADIRTSLKYRHALRELIQACFAAMTLDQVDAALKGNDITFSIVARVSDVVADPQLIANGLVVGTDSREPDYDRTLASPFRIHDEAQRTATRAPTIGEHSREVLREHGLGDAEIDGLIGSGVVGVARAERRRGRGELART